MDSGVPSASSRTNSANFLLSPNAREFVPRGKSTSNPTRFDFDETKQTRGESLDVNSVSSQSTHSPRSHGSHSHNLSYESSCDASDEEYTEDLPPVDLSFLVEPE